MNVNEKDEKKNWKLVIKIENDDRGSNERTNPTEPNRLRFDFYSSETNVTPRSQINSFECLEGMKRRSSFFRNNIHSTTRPNNGNSDVGHLLHCTAKTANRLFDDILTKRQNADGKNSEESNYDVGPDMSRPKEITTGPREIDLTESPTLIMLYIPSGVVVKGHGDCDGTLNRREVCLKDRAKLKAVVDSVAQTVNRFTDREDEECQTPATSFAAVGTQVHGYDVYEDDGRPNPAAIPDVSGESVRDAADPFFDKLMFMERVIARNVAEQRETGRRNLIAGLSGYELFLVDRLALTGDCSDKGLTASCMHWNGTETHLMAVAYGCLEYDFRRRPGAVAVWSTKNSHSPERFYEFDDAVTCVKFSTEKPDRLAVGFRNGNVLIIDVSGGPLKIVFDKSARFPDAGGVTDAFWAVLFENEFLRDSPHECLVSARESEDSASRRGPPSTSSLSEQMTCDDGGRVACYRCSRGTFVEKTAVLLPGDGVGAKRSFCKATKLAGFDRNSYLVGAGNGAIYACAYDNPAKCLGKTAAHFGPIGSLERSWHAPDVYLTTGCDFAVKIWIGDVFDEPVMTLNTDERIEKAVWSPRDSTVVVSIVNGSVLIWDLEKKGRPVFKIKKIRSDGDFTDVAFTSDGKYLSVSNKIGQVVLYVLTKVSSDDKPRGRDALMRTIAKRVCHRQEMRETLCRARPEYVGVFDGLSKFY